MPTKFYSLSDSKDRLIPFIGTIRRTNRSLPGCASLGNNALITRRWRDVDTCSPFHVRHSCHTTRYEQSPTFCWSRPSDGKTRAARSVSSPLPINSVRSFQSSRRCLRRCTPGKPDGGRLETGWHTCRSHRRFDAAGIRVPADQQTEACSPRLIG